MAAEAVRNITADFEAAIFFDNAALHIDQVSKSCPRNLQLVKVNETAPHVGFTKFVNEPLASYVAALGPNSYFDAIKGLGFDDERYDAASGITSENIETGKVWLRETAGLSPRAAVFDWDRTISKIEGIVNLKNPAAIKYLEKSGGLEYSKLLKDAILYLCGGPDRLAQLRDFMYTLHNNNVFIYVLTNNGSCNDGTKFLDDLVKEFFLDIPFSEIICSNVLGGEKGLTLKKTSRFKKICPSSGGRRRRITKNRRSQRRRSLK